MNTALLRKWRTPAAVQETRIDGGELSLYILPATSHVTLAVAGRVTVDSSPNLRSALLDLIRRGAAPLLVIDLSAVSYLDTSAIATVLEALKAACERSVKLRLAGLCGQSRRLAEIAQVDAIFRSWGSEVEFR
jgi:anti-sigma B factor antagonist